MISLISYITEKSN
uniref:Uncharacterized protein n=1 Tax=Arundo donax TaxID=35708 RepID=A0A0A8YG06_ARUDO